METETPPLPILPQGNSVHRESKAEGVSRGPISLISGFLVLGQLKYFWGKSLFGNVSTMHQSRHDHGPRRPHSPPSRDTRHTWTEFKTSERVTGKRGLFLDDVGVSGAPATKGPQRTTSRLCTELESLYRVHCQGENTVPREHATRILLQVTDERVPMQGSPASVALFPPAPNADPCRRPRVAREPSPLKCRVFCRKGAGGCRGRIRVFEQIAAGQLIRPHIRAKCNTATWRKEASSRPQPCGDNTQKGIFPADAF